VTEHNCHLAGGFSKGERLFAQITFNAFFIVGLAAIWQDSAYWALAYVALVAYGIFGLIMRHLVCPRCPHLYRYGACLQAPPAFAKWLVKMPTAAPMNRGEKALFWVVMLAIPLFPQYWLWRKPYLFAVFWVFCAAWYAAQVFYFCKHCRVSSCPFNRAGA